ncbi:MAG TPA: OsmC family protein [Anaerolineaceae bacterium]|nr:OsmC family protein [Anaerolineaceae bacterium]
MEAKVTWMKHNLQFEGTADSGFDITLDTRRDQGGDESGFRPIELLAVGLAGCTAMDVISILKKKGQDVTDFQVLAHVQRAEAHPRRMTHVELEYVVSGHQIDPAAVERAIQLSEEKYCSASATLRPGVPIEHKYRIIDAVESAAKSE